MQPHPLTFGEVINQRAFAASQLISLKERIRQIEKIAKRTPPRTLLSARKQVEEAKGQIPKLHAEFEALASRHADLENLEACMWALKYDKS